MPVYLRKSVNVGPFRFNLSKSGIGLSAGVKGFRLGSGPRGNYVHVGRGGLYYRRTVDTPGGAPPARRGSLELAPTSATVGAMREIDSADASQMSDGSSTDLLKEINHKLSIRPLVPLAVGATGLSLLILILASVPPWAYLIWAAVSLLLVTGARFRDLTAKSVVILYQLEQDVAHAYEKLVDSIQTVSASARVWHIPQSAAVLDAKYHGGATTSVRRTPISARRTSLPVIKANVDFPVLPAGTQLLAFMPERLLVFDQEGPGAVSYGDVKVDVSETKFLEEQGVPPDTKVVDRTWRYVNKKGGPDRRFRDNPEIPVVLYEEIHLMSTTGLNELFQVSRLGTGVGLREAIQAFASKLYDEKPA